MPRLTLAEKQAKKHRKHLQPLDPSRRSPEPEAELPLLVPGEEQPLPTLVGELVWYVHPRYDACFYLGNVVSICPDGQMMCVEDKWKNTSYTYVEGPWTHIGHSCDCAGCG